jgi:hypothetical protein
MSERTVPLSPLDRFIASFLRAVRDLPNGYMPGPQSKTLAADLDMQREFVDALFTSARTRGLLKPAYGRGSRIHWKLSDSGLQFLSVHETS